IVLARALLHPNLAHAIVHTGGLDDGRPFLDSPREWLFYIDILAGIQRVDGCAGMPVIRRGDEDGIDLLHFEQLAMIGKALGIDRFLACLVDLLTVDIAHRRHVYLGILHELAHVEATTITR